MSWLSEKTRSFSNFWQKKGLSYARHKICEQHAPLAEQNDSLDRMIYAVNPVYLEISPENRVDIGKESFFWLCIPAIMLPPSILMLWFLITHWPVNGSHIWSVFIFALFALMKVASLLSVWYFFSRFFHPAEHFIRFDRKRQKVFFMPIKPFEIDTTPYEERPVQEILWKNIRLATCQYKYAPVNIYRGQLLEVDATGNVVRTIDIVKLMPENRALLPLEAIRRYMEEDYASTVDSIRPKRWRQFCRPDWREMFSEVSIYPNSLDYSGSLVSTKINRILSHLFAIIVSPYFFFVYFFNWLAGVLSPSPIWHKSVHAMHEADLAELGVDIYGDPLDSVRVQEQFKPNKGLWLLDKMLAIIAIIVGVTPLIWIIIRGVNAFGTPDFGRALIRPLSLMYLQLVMISATAAAIAHLSKPLKEKIRPNDNYWKPAVVKDTPQDEEKA